MPIHYYDSEAADANVIRTEYVVTKHERPAGFVFDTKDDATAKCKELETEDMMRL
jgi:hypothetical protein